MNRYSYDGPIMEFDRCVAFRWKASTYAPSEERAKINFMYQYKKNNNKTQNTKIILPGKIIEERGS